MIRSRRWCRIYTHSAGSIPPSVLAKCGYKSRSASKLTSQSNQTNKFRPVHHHHTIDRKMPLIARRVSPAVIEDAIRSYRNCRVGATGNPAARCSQYQADGYFGQFLFCPTANARFTENRLLAISKRCGNARKNVQCTSNYAPTPGFVYVIILPPRPTGRW